MDVDGSIRSRNNIAADNDARATGDLIAGNLVTTGNILASGTSVLGCNITSNTGLSINNTGATIQLKSSNVYEAFVQLSGNNLLMGANSGNTGNLIIRMNGNDRTIISSQGDINMEGNITKRSVSDTGAYFPLCYGRTTMAAASFNGTPNASVSRNSKGVYTVSCAGLSRTSTIIVTLNETFPETFANPLCEYFAGAYRVTFYSLVTSDTEDVGFSFIAYK